MRKVFFALAFFFFTNMIFSLDFFISGITERPEVIQAIDYSDEMIFRGTSFDYKHDLARVAIALSDASYVNVLKDKAGNTLTKDLRLMGFADENIDLTYEVDYDDDIYEDDQSAFAIASKVVGARTIVFVIIRGTPHTNNEWLSNININNTTKTKKRLHEGFSKAATQVHNAFVSYLLRHKIDAKSAYVLVTGHSRGGSIANVFGSIVAESDDFLDKSRVHVYTFASTNTTTDYKAGDPKYNFIWNVISGEDLVQIVPLNCEKWDYRKFGHIKVFANYWSAGGERFDSVYQKVNPLFNKFFGRDYCPFKAGPFYPVQVTKLIKKLSDTVKAFYTPGGFHKSASDLMKKIYPPATAPSATPTPAASETLVAESKKGKKKSNAAANIFGSIIDKKFNKGFVYLMSAFNDMHCPETYLSFMLSLDEKEAFSALGYSQVTIDGQAEVAILDEEQKLLARVMDGNVDYETVAEGVAAFSLLSTEASIGFPANRHYTLLITNESIAPTPVKITKEVYNAAGVLIWSDSCTVCPCLGAMYKTDVGERSYSQRKLHYVLLKRATCFQLSKKYTLTPSQRFNASPTIDADTDYNMNLGAEVGCKMLYAITKLGFNMDRPDTIFCLSMGLGSRMTLLGPINIGVEVLNKIAWVDQSVLLDGEWKCNYIPEIKVSLVARPVNFFSISVGCLLDFKIDGLNEGAFNPKIRRATFGYAPPTNNNTVYPAVVVGVKFW